MNRLNIANGFLHRLIYVMCLILFSTHYAFADDMRPASLTITEQNSNQYQVVWQKPIKNGVEPKLNVVFDAQTQSLAKAIKQHNGDSIFEYWQVSRDGGLAGSQIEVDGLQGSRYQVVTRVIDSQGQVYSQLLDTESPVLTVPMSMSTEALSIAETYTIYGIEHILIGLDHLLFVACLVYIARTGRKLFWAITGFTAAHSITLFLAATDTFTVPIAPVEAVIALSIFFLAGEIARNNQNSISLRYPVLVSSSFGLLHGFGFASVLADIGLPASEKLIALLCFNLGVEIGQLIFVAGLFLSARLLKLLWRNGSLDALKLPVSYGCGSIAAFWMIERVAAF
jgi:hydrogenase/urease accessory protein HupE